MKPLAISTLFFSAACFASVAVACECFETDIRKKIKENDQLIVAKALSSPWTLSKKYKKYRFDVDHVLRGVVRNRITIFTAKHSCGAVFHLGRKYLMVVTREGSKFVTHQCHYWEADSEYAEVVIEKYAVKP